ncbi:MAG TPA: hypothetical protein VMW17_00490 [Candidatus Binatia bacterium]|nr:hypothetical protein [Candidatus Binatia bacterium]
MVDDAVAVDVALLVREGVAVAGACVVAVGVGVAVGLSTAPGVPTHWPATQRSLPVQTLPSLQTVLSGALVANMHSPVSTSHCPPCLH